VVKFMEVTFHLSSPQFHRLSTAYSVSLSFTQMYWGFSRFSLRVLRRRGTRREMQKSTVP